MSKKRVLSALTSAVCAAGIVTAFPEQFDKTYAVEAVNNSFEYNYDGWYSNSDWAELKADEGAGFGGTRGMKVSGRTAAEDGATSSKGFYLQGGKKYDYSIKVYSETDETFNLSLMCIDAETGEESTVKLASKEVKGGEWTNISASYKAPVASYEFKLTLNNDSTYDFCFDDV